MRRPSLGIPVKTFAVAFTALLVCALAGGCSTTAKSPPAPLASSGQLRSPDFAGPFKVGGDVHAPVLLNRIPPEYPEEARKGGIRGRVLFHAVISEYGKVESLEVVESDHPLLAKAAADSVRQWRYSPATKEGCAVPVVLTVTVTFNTR